MNATVKTKSRLQPRRVTLQDIRVLNRSLVYSKLVMHESTDLSQHIANSL